MARGSAVATDDFNRASLGANWSQTNSDYGSMQTVTSTYLNGSSNYDLLVNGGPSAKWVGAGSFNNDQWASLVITSPSGLLLEYFLGVMVRASGTNATRSYYAAVVSYDQTGGNCTLRLMKCVSGTNTSLHSASVAFATGDRIEIEAEGTTIRLCQNGSVLSAYTTTDAAISTGAPGVIGGASTHGDDWQAGNFATATIDPAIITSSATNFGLPGLILS